jgi:hypothetical protein
MSIDAVVRNIGIISRNNGVLAGMQASGDEAKELRTLLQDTGALARETSEQLLSLQRGQHASGMPARQRTMLNKLNKDFEFVLRRFQQLAQSSASSQQRRPANKSRAAAPAASSTDADDGPPGASERRGLLAAEREEQEAVRKRQQEQIQVRAAGSRVSAAPCSERGPVARARRSRARRRRTSPSASAPSSRSRCGALDPPLPGLSSSAVGPAATHCPGTGAPGRRR